MIIRNRPTLIGVLLQLLPAAFLSALFAIAGVLHVASRVMVVDAGYRLSSLESEVQNLTRQNDQLKLEVATLKSPLRLEKIARDQLGMVPAHGQAVARMH